MGLLTDLQNAASKTAPTTIQRIRYSDPEWELIARAMLAEMLADPSNIGLSVVQLANQAQRNQLKILLGDSYDPHGSVKWSSRNFTAVAQVLPAIRHLHKILHSLHETSDLFKVSSDENGTQAKRITFLEGEVARLKERRPSFEDFSPEDIIAEAAFIQAQQADRLEKAAAGLKTEIAKVGELVSDSKKQISGDVKTLLDVAVESLSAAIKETRPKPVVPPVLTSSPRNGNGNGVHHKKSLQRR
jgi:hypothetical protein